MPRHVKGPDGVIRTFPDDVTDAEIADVLEHSAPAPKSAFGSIKQGAGEGVGDLKALGSAAMHPLDTIGAMGSQLIEGAKAIPDVARNLMNSETRGATMRGFTEGAIEGGTGLKVDEAKRDPLRAGTRALVGTVLPMAALKYAPAGLRAVAGSRTRAAAAAAERAEMLQVARGLGETVPDQVVANGLADGPKPKPVDGGRLVKEPQRLTPEQEMAKADLPESTELPPAPFSLGEGAPSAQPRVSFPAQRPATLAPAAPKHVPGARIVRPAQPVSMPPNGNVTQAVEEALSELQQPAAATPPVAPPPAPVAPPAAPAVPVLPESWQRLVNAAPETADLPGMSSTGDLPMWARPETLPNVTADARTAVGATKAGRALDMTEDAVREAAPGPSRRPMAAELAEMDNDYLRKIMDERGAVDPKLAVKIGLPVAGGVAGAAMADDDGNPLLAGLLGAATGAAVANPMASMKRFQELRMIGQLSGGALPKSVLGNVGAHLTAAMEQGSTAPLKEMLRVPTNVKNAVSAFRAQPNAISAATGAAPVEGLGRLNLPGRLMGAMDTASTQSLQRAGASLPEAQRLLLSTENPVGAGSGLNKAFQSRIGRFMVPFQRIPINQFSEGVQSLEGVLPRSSKSTLAPVHTSARGRAITAGTIGAGAAAGDQTNNPLVLALLAALAGPRALPFALGAGATAGPRVIERVGVGLPEGSVRDLFDPLRPIDRPALMNFLEQIAGGGQE